MLAVARVLVQVHRSRCVISTTTFGHDTASRCVFETCCTLLDFDNLQVVLQPTNHDIKSDNESDMVFY